MNNITSITRKSALREPRSSACVRAITYANQSVAAVAVVLAAAAGCAPAAGQDGGGCKSSGLLSAAFCDDGLVCVVPVSGGGGTCGPCSMTDPRAVCDVLHTCENGACVACANAADGCGEGQYGRPCLDGGTCLAPLACVPGDTCMLPDAGSK
ncbi:MAG: hypothetical protein WBY94_11000 [Polyangiaceae bacterium]